MAEFSARRVVAIAAIAGAVVGGAVASGVAEASIGGSHDSSNSSSSGTGSVTTASVVRTNLTNTAQVGGSIGFNGSYSVAAPSGTSAAQVSQAQQAVIQDREALAGDQQAASDAAAADDQAIAAGQATVTTDESALSAEETKQGRDCAGRGSSTLVCIQDAQKVGQDQSALVQADQQLASAVSAATRDRHQYQGKVQSDQTKLQGDEATVASLQATAVNPGTTYTYVPKVGDVIREDQAVYSLNGVPVPLLFGSIAAYRAFQVGMGDGADVGQVTHDLIALGFGAGLVQSDHYSTATAAAVERWQTAVGMSATGTVLLGQVVFEPGPIRVTSVTPSVGQALGGGGSGGGMVLEATSTTPVVTVDLDVTQEYLVKAGDAVSIVLPDGTTTVGGHVESVGNVAVCPGGGGSGSGNSAADQSPCSSTGNNNNSSPTVTVTIALDSTPPGATLDQAPVNVDIVSQRADGVLAAPVTALLALAGGGYGVDVVDGSTSHLVGVTTGLYSSTLVQISGPGITAGTRVEVPSS